MEAKEISNSEFWKYLSALNRVSRLDSDRNWAMPGWIVSEQFQDSGYNIIDFVKLNEFSKESSGEIINWAFSISKAANKLASDILRNKFDFNSSIVDDSNLENYIIIDESKRTKGILEEISKDNSKLLTLEFWVFEEIIAELLFKQGYKVEMTKKTKDRGYDILALLNVNGQLPLKFLVECKRYNDKKVGVEVIRSFKEVISTEGANKGIIVTTSYFTKGALEKQREIPYILDYRDKDKVIEMVKDYFKATVN